jgi:hypothetical protein
MTRSSSPAHAGRHPTNLDFDFVNCGRVVGCDVETIGIASFADLLGAILRSRLASLRPSSSIDPQIAALIEHVEAAAVEAGYGSVNVIREAPAATATYCLPSIE